MDESNERELLKIVRSPAKLKEECTNLLDEIEKNSREV